MKISVIGTAGIPANYGGFETLVDNLADFHQKHQLEIELVVYCSSKSHETRPKRFLRTELRYLPMKANGIWSIPYDVWSIIKAVIDRTDTLLILGISGAIALPALRRFGKKRIITNIDGIEWQRKKWGGLARRFLKLSERWAVRYSDIVIADNAAIATYVQSTYGVSPPVIAYGGDHALQTISKRPAQIDLPTQYALTVCRIEPENNIGLILDAFVKMSNVSLVLVGNWENSVYGQRLKSAYTFRENLYLLDPIYEPCTLKYLRSNAWIYVHGHSAGGTNPSLVEAMHFGLPILAFDCDFNRSTTEDCSLYFTDATSLVALLQELEQRQIAAIGAKMKEIASRRYTWSIVAQQYFKLLENGTGWKRGSLKNTR